MPEFQFESFSDFLAMGGYGLYVWVSYGFFAVVMGLNLLLAYRQRTATIRLLKARLQRQHRQPTDVDLPSAAQQAQQQQGHTR